MLLELHRRWFSDKSTIGQLFIDGQPFAYTLEDVVREQAGKPVAQWKVAGQTAIPSGTYTVIVNSSTRFKRLMPLLLNVPGFAGVRIHSGNTAEDTEGCILLGKERKPDWVGPSRIVFDDFFKRLCEGLRFGKATIKITNERQ